MKRLHIFISLLAVTAFAQRAPDLSAAEAGKAPTIDFARQIQPIFARRCLKCHGPNDAEGGLRLNSREAALAELDSSSFAIAPGDVAASALLDRVRSADADERMPPEGKPLTEEEMTAIQQWIKQGAHWAAHWSYRKPERPEVPGTHHAAWVRNPIDAFVLRRLEDAELEPARPAGKIALLRRAYYDLIGLPPTTKEVDEFLADSSSAAFEKVIDRLLDSPQYGEKWARHWLDVVRYAETNGYERDSKKDLIWKYRDYVIRTFNQDKPFDRFILEQLAGDELPDKDAESVIATGFYRLGVWDDEPADRELARYNYLDDIVRTTGETFLGTTIGCARCHDHKIDPIAQQDYYSMLAFFSDIAPHGKGKTNHVPISSPLDEAEFERKLAEKQQREMSLRGQIDAIQSEFLDALAAKHPELETEPATTRQARGPVVLADSIKSGQVWEYTQSQPADDWFEIAFDDSRWKKGPAGFGTPGTPGSVVRTEWRSREIWLRKDFRLEVIPSRLTLNIHHDEDAAIYLNGKLITTLKGYTVKYHRIDITDRSLDVLQTGRNTLAIHCRQTGGGQYIDAGLNVDYRSTPLTVLAKKYGAEVLGQARLAEWRRLRQELAASETQTQEPTQKLERKTEFAMAVAERGRNKTWLLVRGNPSMKGDEVDAAFPQIFDPPAAEVPSQYATERTSGKRRLLAEWIASDRNAVTARVIVNRIWQHHFGRGIVRSSSDFGFQGTPPTHPQLLDWLATEFVARGWRMKALHKLIMMSSTYQMSSEHHPAAAAKDPTNKLFWRFNMRRLSAEEIRDSVLAAGGTLNLTMYGPSVYPPLPQEVLATASRPNAAWGKSPPEQAARRTIYVHVKRSLRPPMLANFDAPDTDTPCAARLTTTVPTQALGMLNSRFMNEQAAKLAARLQDEIPDDVPAQLARAIRIASGREPQADEVQADMRYLEDLTHDEELSLQDALRHYCLMILNANEFVYLD